jgi:hypothetical protein
MLFVTGFWIHELKSYTPRKLGFREVVYQIDNLTNCKSDNCVGTILVIAGIVLLKSENIYALKPLF